MITVITRQIEEIEVIHQNAKNMNETIKQMEEEGWLSVRNHNTLDVPEEFLEKFKEEYPNVEVIIPRKDNFLHRHPYVYYSTFRRTVSETGEILSTEKGEN